ncbi:hypothetical protein EG68_00154 [Paragonimus skrjabini miyazakii]|uniref:Uncharacterized protein n=1 Tax=Paragonimus skrjabini miyazakii TaxID=59628 RepID=A0A8S9Z517_9TREM|nr:hypothetical protein EG68_00154 [Paragonimus skrjabini miyazakii]
MGTENTDFRLRYDLSRFLTKYVNYHECAALEKRLRNGKVRKLGDVKKLPWDEQICERKIESKNYPAVIGLLNWDEIDECLYTSGGLNRMLKNLYQKRIKYAPVAVHTKVEKSPLQYTGKLNRISKRKHHISTLTQQFFELINNERFYEIVKQTEDIKQILDYMWCPTRPLESVGQYAIAKHASIHYILSTHAILPSSECFTPEDIHRIMHLPIEWIGALPRQEDTRCITQFIARFAELFARKPSINNNEMEDPLDKHARKCGQRVFLDIIRYASNGTKYELKMADAESGISIITDDYRANGNIDLSDKVRKFRSTSVLNVQKEAVGPVTDESDGPPPLDWEDQLTRTNVCVVTIIPSNDKIPRHPKVTSFLRPMANKSFKQQHNSWIAVDEMTVMQEATQVLAQLEVARRTTSPFEQLYKVSRGLKRAMQTIRCPSMCDMPKLTSQPSVIEQIAHEEKQFRNMVSHLPHHQYDIDQLKNTNRKVLYGMEPTRYSASWIRDPTENQRRLNWAFTWDPNRRIHVEHAIRSGRLPPLNRDSRKVATKTKPSDGDAPAHSQWQASIRSDQRLHVMGSQSIRPHLKTKHKNDNPLSRSILLRRPNARSEVSEEHEARQDRVRTDRPLEKRIANQSNRTNANQLFPMTDSSFKVKQLNQFVE